MAVLVEVHDARGARARAPARTPLLGINNRNLRTFDVSLQTTLDLAAAHSRRDGSSSPRAASSRRATSPRCVAHGVNAFLVGEAFMRAPDPGVALAALFGAEGHLWRR